MAKSLFSREMGIAVAASLGLHTLWMARDAEAVAIRQIPPAEVLFEAYEAPPPPKVETPEPEAKPVDNVKPEPVTQKLNAKSAPATALPAAAQAGKTLTAPEDADNGLADFTLVQGTGTEYIGGTTSSIGSGLSAVRGAASDKPAQKNTVVGKVAADATGPDRSERPRPLGNDWNCSRLFPNDPEAGDFATVSILVTVGLDGAPKSVTVLKEPGRGFGAAARACAMTQRFTVGRDRLGQPVVSSTPPVTVRFTR